MTMKKNDIKHIETPVSVDKLHFDKENPRYAPYHSLGKALDVDIVKHLALTADLKELLQSIAANGYIKIEPLIVMKHKTPGHYTVLEGNRRLAAIKLLRDPDFVTKSGITNVPPLDKTKAATLEEVYVTEVKAREDARALIGFKHINGPQRWDSFAKAEFAKDWYVAEKGNGVTLRSIANSLGDGHSTIRRLVFGIFVLDQAIKNKLFSIEDRFHNKRIFPFSHLYTGLSKSGFQEYLGIEKAWKDEEPPERPVKKDHLENLRQVMSWLYGSASDEVPPVIKSQNPDLKYLNEILTKPKAVKTLLVKRDLKVAHLDVQPPLELFEKSLINGHKAVEEALSRVSAYEVGEETLLEISNILMKNSKIIHSHLANYHKK
jgi:ParB-like nuclease domain